MDQEESFMKKSLSLLLSVLMLSAAVPQAGAAPAAEAGLNLSCTSAVLMEKETGAFLLEENAHEKLPIGPACWPWLF